MTRQDSIIACVTRISLAIRNTLAGSGSRRDAAIVACGFLVCTPLGAAAQPAPATSGAPTEHITVAASRLNLLGHATTASQGVVTRVELQLRPIYRVGQLLESVPGLVVTVHSGEGKAYQYLARGFNLDHGTDIADFVDGMPLNRPTNAHGQGYSDLNFLIPETLQSLEYTKGPYYAAVGDFGAVAAVRQHLADDLPDELIGSVGTLGDERAAATGTLHLANGDRLLGAVDISHLDGPFNPPNNFRKTAGELRYSDGTATDGYSITALYYRGQGRLSTDQPERAVQEGLITRFGTLDPTDGNFSERESLSGQYAVSGDVWQFKTNAFAVHSLQTLWNDFTHFLNDPRNGDQEQQDETRTTLGGATDLTYHAAVGTIESDTTIGVQGRYDNEYVDKRHTKDRVALDYCDDMDVAYVKGPFACNADLVQLGDAGAYAETATHWTTWLRTVLGAREEFYNATDRSLITGFKGIGAQALFQPKGSLILSPWHGTEIYFSAGRGFHSDDARGVFQTLPLEGIPGVSHRTPLLARSNGEEIGLRSTLLPNLDIQAAFFQIEFASELIYDQDVGQDQANAPSKRRGLEVSAEYHPLPWLELNTDLAATKARFATGNPASYGLNGRYIPNAPDFIGSFGVLVNGPGKWYGGLQARILGSYPLNPDDAVRGKGYSELNLDAGYRLTPATRIELSLYNLLDERADAFNYDYVTRLPGEPSGGITNERNGLQFHPLEPLSGRLTLRQMF
jgi:outer membrane receptor protein involved in Fe transport